MEWYGYAIITAILVAAATLLEKKTLKLEHSLEFATIFSILNLILSIPFFFSFDWSLISTEALLILFGGSILGSLSLWYTLKGMRHLEISEVSPLFTLSPVFTSIFAFLFLGELLTASQMMGILLLLFGAYLIELKGKDLSLPFKAFRYSKYIHLVLFSIVLMSLSSVVDRLVLAHYALPVEIYIAFVHLYFAVIFLFIYHKCCGGLSTLKPGFKKFGVPILFACLLTIAHRYTQAQSVALAEAGLVAAVKRSSTFFIILIGGAMFKEQHILLKTLASLFMIAGMLLVVL